ncbi:hypothetical protein AZE42_05673 [Rhizopogon vesiculosus]|uniref:Uncharacterized protein n=1 Tax=Rhizopogon vesiculosus TaxID=180088 RepID=A0A1J8QEU2_9AGAM|nr:hypothetical protein AZE42_05673 [Rhizopogon vesiculosus]
MAFELPNFISRIPKHPQLEKRLTGLPKKGSGQEVHIFA